jgi:hypothetical protein
MEKILIHSINYIYSLGALAFILEYVFSKEKGEAFTLKLIDWSNYLSRKQIDRLIAKVSKFFSEKYDAIYGNKYFGKKEWVISSTIAFTYCYLFYIVEKNIGFQSTLIKQLGYWFIPNLIADIISINFTRWLLSKLYNYPEKYIKYLIFDILVFILCFYICFSFTMIYLSIFSQYSYIRILLHPIYMFQNILTEYPSPIAIDNIYLFIMASTTFIPTLLHALFVFMAISLKLILPVLNTLMDNMIERMVSFELHPLGVAVIVPGIFFFPLFVILMVVI